MNKEKEKKALEKLKKMKKKFEEKELQNDSESHLQENEFPLESFRKNIGCGG